MVKTFKVKINFIDNSLILNHQVFHAVAHDLSRQPIRWSCSVGYDFNKLDFGEIQSGYSKNGDFTFRQITNDSIIKWLSRYALIDIPICNHSGSPRWIDVYSKRGCLVNYYPYRRDGRRYMVPTIITIYSDSSEITTIIRDFKLGLVDEG